MIRKYLSLDISPMNTSITSPPLLQIKLVNINSTDIVDGRPSVVLGLIWTIILFFQVTFLLTFNLKKLKTFM